MGFVTLGKTGIKAQKQAFGCLPIQRISKEDAVSPVSYTHLDVYKRQV